MDSKHLNASPPFGTRIPRSYPGIAWGVIIACTSLVALLHFVEVSSSSGARTVVAEQHLLEQVEGQYALGIDLVTGDSNLAGAALMGFEQGSMGRRLRGVVLNGAVHGNEAARDALLRIEAQAAEAAYEPSDNERDVIDLLERRYAEDGGGAVALGETGQVFLVEQLGWFGELATISGSDTAARSAVDEPAIRTCIAIFCAVIGFGGGFFLGVVLLIVLIVFATMGRLRHGLGPPGQRDGLFAEAFAIWIVLFLAFQLLLGFLIMLLPSLERHSLLLVGVVQLASLVVVGWPVVRGLQWASVRTAMGWTRGTGLWRELGWGFCGWLMLMPLLAGGILIMFILMALTDPGQTGTGFEPTPAPVHPILLSVAESDVWVIIQVYFVAVIVAPVLEETVFRGMLYRQLRSTSASMRAAWSVIMSTLVVSVVFAALHPQGLVAIPALASLAVGMSLMREWRGSLVGSMTMHACNNGIMITLMVLLFS